MRSRYPRRPAPSCALALNLFEAGQLSLAQAAKIAGLSQDAFMEVLVEVGTRAADYPPLELEGELDATRLAGLSSPMPAS
jgi:predicted HTH domain antitoxin